jgi:anti-sigma B factor antagonist
MSRDTCSELGYPAYGAPRRCANINSEKRALTMRKSSLTIEATRSGSTTVVAASGSLDIATAEEFETAVREALADGTHVVVDLSDLSLCDSTGLGAMVRLHRRAVAADASLTLRRPQRSVAEMLAMTGIDKVIPTEH